MATIQHRKGKDIYVQWVGADGKRRGKSFPENRKRQAKQFAAEQDSKRKEHRSGIGLEAAAVKCLEDREEVTQLGTWTRYESVLTHFVEYIGAKPLVRVGVDHISSWRNDRLKDHAKSTVRNDLKCIRAFLNWCMARKWIADNPAKLVDIPKVKKRLPKYLPPQEIEKMLADLKKAPPEIRLIGLFALRAGMRRFV